MLSNDEKRQLQALTLKAATALPSPTSGDDVYPPLPGDYFDSAPPGGGEPSYPGPTFDAELWRPGGGNTGRVPTQIATLQLPGGDDPALPPTTNSCPTLPPEEDDTDMQHSSDGLPADPRWRLYMQKAAQCCGIPLPCAVFSGNVSAPTPQTCAAAGSAPYGCLVPIPFSKSIAAGASDTVLIAPNQVCVPAALDGSSSGIDIVLTDIQGDNKNSLYTQGDGDIVTALILATAFGTETFWGKNNPFPRAAPRIDKTHGLTLFVTNGGGAAELASGVLWAWVM